MMMRNRFSRRSFVGLAGGLAAVALTRPVWAQTESTPSAGDGAFAHPTGATDVILRIETAGGFVPPQTTLSELPGFSLYGDGRLITQGPTIMIYPPPALPNLLQSHLTEAGIQQVLTAAKAAGLMDGNKTYSNNLVADAPTTVFTVNANGESNTVAVYGLGFDDDPAWTPEEKDAIARLAEFAGSAGNIVSSGDPALVVSAEQPYPVERLQIVTQLIDPSMATPDPEMNQPPLDWPLATSLADATPKSELIPGDTSLRCGVIAGNDTATVLAAAAQANVLTPWTSDGSNYYVTFRPLLPDETGCPPRQPEGEQLPEASPTA